MYFNVWSGHGPFRDWFEVIIWLTVCDDPTPDPLHTGDEGEMWDIAPHGGDRSL